jgi:hypothetical protein
MSDVSTTRMPITDTLFGQVKLKITANWLHYLFALAFHKTLLN